MKPNTGNELAADQRTIGPTKRKRGPAPRLNRPKIAAAVLEVGFQDLTLAAVAKRLGVAPGGLYRYVEDREDLVIAAIDLAFASMKASTADDWVTMLRDEAWQRWELLTQHPGLVAALREAGRPSPEIHRRFRFCAEAAVEFGLSPADALLAIDTVVDFVNDGSQQYAALQSVLERGDGDAFVAKQRVALGDEFGEVMNQILHDPKAFFARKLDVVLAGLKETTTSPS